MAPRKSSRLQAKGFKSKKVTEKIQIEDTSSSSEESIGTTTKEGNVRESRSKERHDEIETPRVEVQETQSLQQDEQQPPEPTKPESEDNSEHTISEETPVPNPAKRKGRTTSLQSSARISNKVRECSFIDFKFFSENGFYMNHWLNRIGCKNLGKILEVIDESIIKEFYENLEELEDLSLKSKVVGKVIKITRKDLVDCFEMKDCNDDARLISLSKSEIFRELNDGIGSFKEKDIFSTDFELLIRLLHKAIVDCILPKMGSTTTISTDEGLIILAIKKNLNLDVPTMILKHMWRTQRNKPYGNLLMKIFKFKNIKLPKKFKSTIGLKKFGELSIKKMGILVSEKFWFSKDGSWYRHSKFNKFKFDWKKIKSIADGELLPEVEAEADSEGGGRGSEKEKLHSKRAGKEKVLGKKRKAYEIQTGGKFEIREGGQVIEEAESESDSEGVAEGVAHPGETSKSGLKSELMEVIFQKFDDLKSNLTTSILQAIKSQTQLDSQPLEQPKDISHEEILAGTSLESDRPPISQPPSEPQIILQAPVNATSNEPQVDILEKESKQSEEEVHGEQAEEVQATTDEVPNPPDHTETQTSEALEALHLISIPPKQPSQIHSQQVPTDQVAEDILNLNPPQSSSQPSQPQPDQPKPTIPVRRTLPARKKKQARKNVPPVQQKKI